MIRRSYNKYKNKKTVIDGITFDSKREANRYTELKLMEQAGLIKDLVLQPKFLLQDKFKYRGRTYRKIEYLADFSYFSVEDDILIVEDVKGVKTDVFRLKEKLLIYKFMKENENIDFRII